MTDITSRAPQDAALVSADAAEALALEAHQLLVGPGEVDEREARVERIVRRLGTRDAHPDRDGRQLLGRLAVRVDGAPAPAAHQLEDELLGGLHRDDRRLEQQVRVVRVRDAQVQAVARHEDGVGRAHLLAPRHGQAPDRGHLLPRRTQPALRARHRAAHAGTARDLRCRARGLRRAQGACTTAPIDRRFGGRAGAGLPGQFGLGLLLGAIWSPCVGPTLGAASVLAAKGENLGQVALTMLVFGIGAGLFGVLGEFDGFPRRVGARAGDHHEAQLLVMAG